MIRSLLASMTLSIVLLAGTGIKDTTAQERVLSPKRAAGHDGVVTQCISFARITFANNMCKGLAKSASKLAKENGLEHIALGKNEWGYGIDEYLPLPQDANLKNPVWLTFYIRATDNPNSLNIWMSLYKPLSFDGKADWKPGRLVLWEDSGIGAGDLEIITDGLGRGVEAKLKPVFEALGYGKP